jgi:hypothetical protein
MNINIRFIKLCIWSFGHVVKKYKVGEEINIDEAAGYRMIKSGYAVLVEDNLNLPEYVEDEPKKFRKPRKSPEDKMLKPTEDKEVIK